MRYSRSLVVQVNSMTFVFEQNLITIWSRFCVARAACKLLGRCHCFFFFCFLFERRFFSFLFRYLDAMLSFAFFWAWLRLTDIAFAVGQAFVFLEFSFWEGVVKFRQLRIRNFPLFLFMVCAVKWMFCCSLSTSCVAPTFVAELLWRFSLVIVMRQLLCKDVSLRWGDKFVEKNRSDLISSWHLTKLWIWCLFLDYDSFYLSKIEIVIARGGVSI